MFWFDRRVGFFVFLLHLVGQARPLRRRHVLSGACEAPTKSREGLLFCVPFVVLMYILQFFVCVRVYVFLLASLLCSWPCFASDVGIAVGVVVVIVIVRSHC